MFEILKNFWQMIFKIIEMYAEMRESWEYKAVHISVLENEVEPCKRLGRLICSKQRAIDPAIFRRESFEHFGGKEQMAFHHHSRCEVHEISSEIKRERYVSGLASIIASDRV